MSIDLRHRFASDTLATLPGPRVVVMAFDRVDRDLAIAQRALDAADYFTVNSNLTHAQALLQELLVMLDQDAWEHAPALAAIYDYVIRLLARANVTKQPAHVIEAQRLVTELGDAFRSAADSRRADDQEPAPSGFSAHA